LIFLSYQTYLSESTDFCDTSHEIIKKQALHFKKLQKQTRAQ